MDASEFLALVEQRLDETGMKAATASRLAVGNPYLIRNMQKTLADPEIAAPRMPSFEHLQALCKVLGIEFYIGPPRQHEPSAVLHEIQDAMAQLAAASPLSIDRLVRVLELAEAGLAEGRRIMPPDKKAQLVAAVYEALTIASDNEATARRIVGLVA